LYICQMATVDPYQKLEEEVVETPPTWTERMESLFWFDTVKLVTVHSVKLGVLHRLIQVLAILYIVVYCIYFKMGYQEYSKVSGIVYVKAKGLGYINDTTNGLQIYDTNDLVVPPTEADALFVTTGFIKTIQQRDICDSTTKCTTDEDCKPALTPNGEILGDCDTTSGFCRIQGWCPLESDKISSIQTLEAVSDITVFMRSSVKYETFNVFQADDPDPVRGLNLFSVQEMLNGRNISDCSTSGCIVNIQVDWTCNLNNVDKCKPHISFNTVQGGFNFRKVTYVVGQGSRELNKLYGVRVLLKVVGTGGRFSPFQTVITIGSGAAFITLATVITDLILLLFYREDSGYQGKKWQHMHFEDDK